MAVSGRTRTGARPSIKIQPIDFDHRRCVLAGLRLDVFDDIVDDRGRRENDRRCGIGEHGNGALVVGTTLGNRKRNRDNSGLQRGNKANDIIWEDGHAKDSKFPPVRVRGNLSLDALILMNFIQTNSAVYRRLERYDDIPADVMPLDWYLHVRHAVHGDIAMLPDTMAVYRRHAQGMWHNQVVDPPKFWLTQGPGHAATFDAMLDLFPGDPAREELIAVMADWILRQIANVPGPEGRAALQETIARHPRIAMLALQHRGATPARRLKTQWRKLAAATPSRRGLVDVWPSRLRRGCRA